MAGGWNGGPHQGRDTGPGRAVGLEIEEPELTEVMYSLNALLEAMDRINPPGLDLVEPLPIILPSADDAPPEAPPEV